METNLSTETKQCSKCKQIKPLDEFYVYRDTKRQSYCKDCLKAYVTERQREKRRTKRWDGAAKADTVNASEVQDESAS